jgi:ABC-type nickel/cobalt efflux system permease component RcnA
MTARKNDVTNAHTIRFSLDHRSWSAYAIVLSLEFVVFVFTMFVLFVFITIVLVFLFSLGFAITRLMSGNRLFYKYKKRLVALALF